MKRVSPSLRKSIEDRIRHSAEDDMGKRQNVHNQTMQLDEVEPMLIPVMEQAFHTLEELRQSAEEVGMTLEQYMNLGRFVRHPNGKYYMK